TSGKHRYHQPRTLNQAATQGGGTSLLLCADAPEAALRALQRAETAGYRNAGYLRHSPLLQPLRGMPEFAALLARIDADLADQRAQLRRRKLLPPDAISEAAAAI
ncbi:hypothetical protein VDF55_21000, partial [Xanthomonas campestris pv. raphani]|nr:hypothetical protein [Xanthomonas campestris pv. raphani]